MPNAFAPIEHVEKPTLTRAIRYCDNRGYMRPLFEHNVNDNICIKTTYSFNGVIRGFHWQAPPFDQTKVIHVLMGEIYDLAIPMINMKPDMGNINYNHLRNDGDGLIIPKNYAHGYQTLSEFSIVLYVCLGEYKANHEASINPLSLNIPWPIDEATVSDKDLQGLSYE